MKHSVTAVYLRVTKIDQGIEFNVAECTIDDGRDDVPSLHSGEAVGHRRLRLRSPGRRAPSTRPLTATDETAIDLSIRLGHHLFDTLYHAVAFRSPDTTLLTADRRYFDKARDEGRIVLLSQFILHS